MSLNLQQKEAVVAEVARQIAGAQAVILAENRGMAVADMTKLRANARASGVYFRVVKNTLVRRAVVDTPFAGLADRMVGPLAYGIGDDPAPAEGRSSSACYPGFSCAGPIRCPTPSPRTSSA